MAPPSYSQTCNATTAAWLALVCLAAQAAQAQDQCDGPVVKLLVQAQAFPAPNTVYGVLATFGGIPSFNLTQPARIAVAEPLNACGTALNKAPGSYYLVERGNCSFVDKYTAVLAAGGVGMLLYDDKPGCINMGGSPANSSSNGSVPAPPAPRNASQPPAISIDRADGLALVEVVRSAGDTSDVTIQLQLLEVPALDASAMLLWLMAVGTVVVGSLWSGIDYAIEIKGAGPGLEGGHGSASDTGDQGGMEVLEITMAGAVGFVVFSSAMLVLLYFFLNEAFFYVILVGFCLAGMQALAIMLLPAVRVALPHLAWRQVALPCGWGHVSGGELLVTPVAVAVAVVWAIARNASWSWVLQDLLGIAIMLLVLRTLRLPNLKVACVLLPLCFCYDVFWVFLQPMLTGGGSSVMVEVAGGGDVNEFLPMLLRVPRLSGPPIIRGAYSLLGFGDVILPGMLVALTRRLDIAGKTSWHAGYYVASVMGYGAGLLLTYVALMFSWFGDEGQPALLYLVPCTLGVVLMLAAFRGELRELLRSGDEWGGSAGYEIVEDQHDADFDYSSGLQDRSSALLAAEGEPQCTAGGPNSGLEQAGGADSSGKQSVVVASSVLINADGRASNNRGRSHSTRGRSSGRGSGSHEAFV